MSDRTGAHEGPWVSRDDIKAFLAFCAENGHATREHSGLSSTGYQVQHAGHWMGVVWNKAWRRFTADRRLSLIVQSFAAQKQGSKP